MFKDRELITVVNRFLFFNPLNAELNAIRHLLALVGARHIVHVSRVRANTSYVTAGDSTENLQ